MSLSYVQPGEKITAQGYNSLVDAVGGEGNYSSEGFQNNGNGTVFWNKASLDMKYQSAAWRTMFQVTDARYWKQTSRGQWNPPEMAQTTLIDLGSNPNALVNNVIVGQVPVDGALLVVSDSAGMDDYVSDSTYENASGERGKWVDLGISATAIYCDLIREKPPKDEEDAGDKYYIVITDRSIDEQEDIISRAESLVQPDGELEVINRFDIAKKIGSEWVQNHTGFLYYNKKNQFFVDSQIPQIKLSSLQELGDLSSISPGLSSEPDKKCYEMYKFDDNSFKSDVTYLTYENDPKNCQVVLRFHDESVSSTSIDYVDLTSTMFIADSKYAQEDEFDVNSSSLKSESNSTLSAYVSRINGWNSSDDCYEPKKKSEIEGKEDEYAILLRHTNDGKEENAFIGLGDFWNDGLSGDSNVKTPTTKSIDIDDDVVKLYDFNSPNIGTYDKNDSVLIRSVEGGVPTLKYAKLSGEVSNPISGDSNVTNPDTRSIDIENDIARLYGFDDPDTLTDSEQKKSLILARYVDGGVPTLKYTPLSSLSGGGGEVSLSGDADVSSANTTSIERKNDYFRLYAFDSIDDEHMVTKDDIEGNPLNYDLLVRKWDSKELAYVNVQDIATSGYSGTVNIYTGNSRCNSSSGWKLQNEYIKAEFENGLLKGGLDVKYWSDGIPTTKFSDLL